MLYVIPKSLIDTQHLINSLSFFKVVLLQWISGYSFLPSSNLADTLSKVSAIYDSSTFPIISYFFSKSASLHELEMKYSIRFLPKFKFLPYLLRSLLFLAPLVVFFLVYIATERALFLLHIFTGLVDPRLLCTATVASNYRTSIM